MPGVRVLDPSGQLGEIPESELDGAIADGFTLPPASTAPVATQPERTVRVLDPSGQLGEIPESELEGALADGFTRHDTNDGGLAQLVTAGEGALGLGFTEPLAQLEGFGTALGSKIAGVVHPELPAAPKLDEAVQQARLDIGARKEANPWTSGLSGAAGTVAATLATGGAAAIPAVDALAARATASVAAKIGIEAAKIATGTLGQRIILQTVKAGVPNIIEGAAFGLAQGVDAGLQAAYAVDGELSAGDYASVAEAGAQGLGIGILSAGVATPLFTSIAEGARSAGRAVGSMFGRGAGAADDLRALPSGETAVQADPIAEVEAVGAQRAAMLMPDSAVPPVQPVPGESLALLDVDNAALGMPVSPYAKGYTPGKAEPDASKLIDDQGPMLFADVAPSARKRASKLGELASKLGDHDEIMDDGVRSIIDDHDELLKIMDRADTLNGIGAKRAKIAAEFDAPTAPASDDVGIVLADGTAGVPSAAYRPDDRTVAVIRKIVDDVKRTLDDGTTYELQELGGTGKGIKLAKAIQQKATEYEQALAQGKAGTGYMILDDLKRIFGDFKHAKNAKIKMLITGPTGKEGIYGDLQRHLLDEDVFMGLAQLQKPANSSWSARISAGQDESLRGFAMQAGEPGVNAFELSKRTNGTKVRSMINESLKPESLRDQEAFIRHGRAVANDIKTRAETWGNEAAKADALRAQVLVARIEAKRDMAVQALRAKQGLSSAKEVIGDMPIVGGISKTAIKLGQHMVKAAGRWSTPAESVAHAAVNANAAISRYADVAAATATGAAKKSTAAAKAARVATSASLIAVRAASTATIQAYARDTQKDSPTQRMKLNDAAMLADEAPELVQPLQDLQRSKDAFLAGKLAPIVASGKVDPVSQVKLVRYINAAEHPDQAMERIANMGATAEDIETMWTLNPSQMGKLRDKTLAAIAAQKKPPTRDAQAYFTRVFHLHDTEYLQWLKAVAPPPEPPAQPSSATIKFAMPDPSLRSDELLK